MTNYNERLDEILSKHNGDLGVTWEDPDVVTPYTKQAINSLVEEARIDELNDVPFEAGSPAEEHYKLRIAELSKESVNE